jgi:hypothetical protein
MTTKTQARKNLKKAAKAYKESVRQPVTVELQEEHISVINRALETYQRLKLGQIKHALDEAFDTPIDYEDAMAIENFTRKILFPELSPNASYGIYNTEKVGDATLAYELYKTFKQYKYFKRTDGWREGWTVDAYGNIGVVPTSKVPYAVIKNFSTEKFFPFPKKYQEKAFEFFTNEDYESIWKMGKKALPKLPRGEQYRIGCNFDVVGFYVDKPEKNATITWGE